MFSALKHECGPAKRLLGGLVQFEHSLTVPLCWTNFKSEEKISVFVREVVLEKNVAKRAELTALVFLQGGPGFPAPRPSGRSGWMGKALENDFRVLLLDQRGTGKSTPVTVARLLKMQIPEQAHWLSNFRADSIARDVEAVRIAVSAEKKIALIGQSFGGFIMLSYLSLFGTQNLERCLFTCALPPVGKTADDLYQKTYKRMAVRNAAYYHRFPEDVAKVKEIVNFLEEKNGVATPNGGTLTVDRFLMLGLGLGRKEGCEAMHWLIDEAWEVPGEELSLSFLTKVEGEQVGFETNLIYFLLHEAIYCCPSTAETTSEWAAARQLEQNSDYHWKARLTSEEPIFFTGEMVFAHMSESFKALGSLKPVANMLAHKEWTEPLYDLVKLRNIASPDCPMAAVVSFDDVYVDQEFSSWTAAHMGPDLKLWISNEFQHSAIRDDGARVFETLLKMTRGESDIPS